jgi:hypothetical protein
MSDYYDVGGVPSFGAPGDSSPIRNEFKAVQDGISNKLPALSGNALKIIGINAGATKMDPVATTGTGSVVLATSPTITSLTASSINSTSPLHQNDIINGDFRIAQAGTSFVAPASDAYDLDGWINGKVGAAIFTIAQVAGSTTGRLARQVTITTADAAVAAGDVVFDATKIEGYNVEKYVGNTFTVAFRAKVPVTGIHCVSLRNSGLDRSYVKEINFPTANVWQDCSFTVTGGLPTAGTWNYTNGTGLLISFTHLCGTTFQTTPDAWQTGNFTGTSNQVNDCATVSNVWALEKVTMNLGAVASVSEISYEQELLRCQRYYGLGRLVAQTYFNGSTANAADFVIATAQFKAAMRTTPSVILTNNTSGTLSLFTSGSDHISIKRVGLFSDSLDANWTASARI